MDQGIQRAVIVWHRRSGKDKTCWNYMIRKAFEKVGTYFYFLPSYTQAKKVIWDNIDNNGFKMLDHIPQELVKRTNGTELKIELINGSIIQLIAADEFSKSGVGTNPIGVVWSEYSLTNAEARRYVSPILAANGGWEIVNFTPRGLNHAHTLLQQAKENPKWFWQIITAEETEVFTKEALEEEKRNNPIDFFEQEYYCKFVDGAGAFFKRIKENLYLEHKHEPWKRYQMGVDLAKYQDYTVITLLDLHTFQIVKQDRFNQMDYTLQKAKIEAAYLRYNKPQIWIDSTGVGEPIYDDLLQKGMNVQPYHFTEQSRMDLLRNLQLLIEQDRIKLPEDEILISELQSFQYTLTPTHRVKVQVPDGIHDDMVMSLALACWQAPQNPLPKPGSLRYLNKTQPIEQTMYN